MEDIRSALQVNIESPYWDEAYEMALAEPEIPSWLDSAFLTKMQEEGFLTNVYDGMAKKPAVLFVKVGGRTLKTGEDYAVSYSSNTKAGTSRSTGRI